MSEELEIASTEPSYVLTPSINTAMLLMAVIVNYIMANDTQHVYIPLVFQNPMKMIFKKIIT